MADHKGLDALTQQESVFNQALVIYEERSDLRGEVWAEFGPEDALMHCESKVARIKAGLSLIEGPNADRVREAVIDDVLDLVNYAGFLHRHLTGDKPS